MLIYVKTKHKHWDGIQSVIGVFTSREAAESHTSILRDGEYTQINEHLLKGES